VNTYPDGGRDHWYAGDVGPDVVQGSEWPVCSVPDAEWIAALSPAVAESLADLLRAVARHIELMEGDCSLRGPMLALVSAINPDLRGTQTGVRPRP
jgi:hypothetical protein